jgi:hypothetical protein
VSGALKHAGGFVLVTAVAAALVGIGSVVTFKTCSFLAGAVAAVVLGLPLALRGGWGPFGLGAAAVLVVLGGFPLEEYGRVAGGEPAALSLAEFAKRPDVVRVRVAEAVRVDVAGAAKVSHRHENGRASPRRDHVIAPVVPASWQPGDPVHVYAACYNVAFDRGCSDAWSVATDDLVRVPADQAACYRELVPAGANLDEVAFVHWDRPGAYVEALWSEWTGTLRTIGLIWLGFGVLVTLGTRGKR